MINIHKKYLKKFSSVYLANNFCLEKSLLSESLKRTYL